MREAMKCIWWSFLFFDLLTTPLRANHCGFKSEGIIPRDVLCVQDLPKAIYYFIPFDSVICQIGTDGPLLSSFYATQFPYGKLIVIEPNSHSLELLEPYLRSFLQTKLLPMDFKKGVQEGNRRVYTVDFTKLPGTSLDNWCEMNGIQRIDALRVDLKGKELNVLKGAKQILKNTWVVSARTGLSPLSTPALQFFRLKNFLMTQGFELYAHVYIEGKEGESIFIKKFIYESMFR